MKALTVHQPWVGLIFAGWKNVENRSWSTEYRGRLLIHSGAAWEKHPRLGDRRLHVHPIAGTKAISWDRPDGLVVYDVPAGLLQTRMTLGSVELYDVVEDADRENLWAVPGMNHWLLREPLPLMEPIQASGQLRLWTAEDARLAVHGEPIRRLIR